MFGTAHEIMPLSTLTTQVSFSAAFICNKDNKLDSTEWLLMIIKYILHKHR